MALGAWQGSSRWLGVHALEVPSVLGGVGASALVTARTRWFSAGRWCGRCRSREAARIPATVAASPARVAELQTPPAKTDAACRFTRARRSAPDCRKLATRRSTLVRATWSDSPVFTRPRALPDAPVFAGVRRCSPVFARPRALSDAPVFAGVHPTASTPGRAGVRRCSPDREHSRTRRCWPVSPVFVGVHPTASTPGRRCSPVFTRPRALPDAPVLAGVASVRRCSSVFVGVRLKRVTRTGAALL
jgi:hypothetical protein